MCVCCCVLDIKNMDPDNSNLDPDTGIGATTPASLARVLRRIWRSWSGDYNSENRNPDGFPGVVRFVLSEDNVAEGDFMGQLATCGCCRKHSHGMYVRGEEHNPVYDNNVTECNCSCRHIGHHLLN